MKKVMTALAFVFAVGFAQAQTQTDSSKATADQATTTNTQTQYEYYPDANVYYNDAAKTYWYYDSTSTQWQNAEKLPSTYTIDDKSQKNTFYYNGANVWEKNAEHVKTYGKKGKPENK